jgi:hypothetical protein
MYRGAELGSFLGVYLFDFSPASPALKTPFGLLFGKRTREKVGKPGQTFFTR